jgi:hypothetical protein
MENDSKDTRPSSSSPSPPLSPRSGRRRQRQASRRNRERLLLLGAGRQAYRLIMKCLIEGVAEDNRIIDLNPESLIVAAAANILTMQIPRNPSQGFQLPDCSVLTRSVAMGLPDGSDPTLDPPCEARYTSSTTAPSASL